MLMGTHPILITKLSLEIIITASKLKNSDKHFLSVQIINLEAVFTMKNSAAPGGRCCTRGLELNLFRTCWEFELILEFDLQNDSEDF